MSGLEIPDSGAVYYDQINLADLSEAERTAFRKDQIGFIFQQYYLLPQLTVEQNIKVGAYLAGNQDFEDLIHALGLEEIRYHYPRACLVVSNSALRLPVPWLRNLVCSF